MGRTLLVDWVCEEEVVERKAVSEWSGCMCCWRGLARRVGGVWTRFARTLVRSVLAMMTIPSITSMSSGI
jgi:hypothetical protein